MPVVSRLRFFARYNVHISKAGNLKGIGLDEGRIARFHIADDRLSPVVDVDMLDPDVLVTPVPVAGGGPRLALNRLATVGPPRTDTPRFAAATTSEPSQFGNRRRVQAIWTASAPSISFCGLAASISASTFASDA